MNGKGISKFYMTAESARTPEGWTVTLDGRALRTPQHKPVLLPTKALADAVAAEWRAQENEVRPDTMPLTKMANTAIDGIGANREAMVHQIASFAKAELLCYRASEPELKKQQKEIWDPLLAWARERYKAHLHVTEGISFMPQSDVALLALEKAVAAYDDFHLAALASIATVTGSVVLTLALVEGRVSPHEAFAASTLDETYQSSRWGKDAEAEARLAAMMGEVVLAARLLVLLRES